MVKTRLFISSCDFSLDLTVVRSYAKLFGCFEYVLDYYECTLCRESILTLGLKLLILFSLNPKNAHFGSFNFRYRNSLYFDQEISQDAQSYSLNIKFYVIRRFFIDFINEYLI